MWFSETSCKCKPINVRTTRNNGQFETNMSHMTIWLLSITKGIAACIQQVPPDWKRSAGRPSHLALAPCNWGRPWPSELWPRNCLEKGHYSRRMATHCGHSNAPVEYALKEEELRRHSIVICRQKLQNQEGFVLQQTNSALVFPRQ